MKGSNELTTSKDTPTKKATRQMLTTLGYGVLGLAGIGVLYGLFLYLQRCYEIIVDLTQNGIDSYFGGFYMGWKSEVLVLAPGILSVIFLLGFGINKLATWAWDTKE